jgi:double-stranded uracil-DNA glycosylase
MPSTSLLLDDVLQPGLTIIFCGTALGRTSAHTKSYYAHGSNLFWSSLHLYGLTSRQLNPSEYRQLIGFGIGLTDLCKTSFGNDNDLPPGSFDVRSFRHKIERYQPKFLAFTSKKAGSVFLGRNTELGWQTPIGATRVYVLPSTSLNARWQWNDTKHHWQIFADAVR